MLIKVDGMCVENVPDDGVLIPQLQALSNVHDALEGRVIVDSILHASGRSINLITAPPTDHLPHVRRLQS